MAVKSMCSRQNMKAKKSWYIVSGRRMVAKPTSTSFLNCVGFGGWGRGLGSGVGGMCAARGGALGFIYSTPL